MSAIVLFESSVQWYCFLLYGTAAGTVFNKVFFNVTGNENTALLLSYMSFAIGYIAGPIGAVFFGHVGDKLGRKYTMYVSLLVMGISTAIMGILPPSLQAGAWVAVVLQLLRLAQCFGYGGTWGGSILLAYENVPRHKRAFYAAIPQMGLPVGFGLSSILIAVPSITMNPETFLGVGWRVPFLAAIVLTVIVVKIKGHMMETDDFKRAQAKLESQEAASRRTKVGFVPMVRGYWKTLLLGCGTRWIEGALYNTFIVWSLSYLVGWLHMPLYQTYVIAIVACAFKIPLTWFGGRVASRLGATRTFVIGALASAVLSIPTLKVIEWSHGNLFVAILAIVLGWSVAYNLIWACIGSMWPTYFETEVRYSGISFVYHVPSFIVAGLVPTICTLLINAGNGNTIYIGIYCTIVALISAACAVALRYRHQRGRR